MAGVGTSTGGVEASVAGGAVSVAGAGVSVAGGVSVGGRVVGAGAQPLNAAATTTRTNRDEMTFLNLSMTDIPLHAPPCEAQIDDRITFH
jgi:hypothetical protein